MEITATLAADLAILSEALDDPDADIAEALRRLAADARSAVGSYLGLAVMSGSATFPLTLIAMEESAHPDDVVSSLMIPLADEGGDGAGESLVVILYAARPGAFVDLAADLCWLTGRRLGDFTLDRHLRLPAESKSGSTVRASSLVNQAIGVLLGRGYTLPQAELELDARATAAGHSRSEAAVIILATLPRDGTGAVPGAP